jgi:Outer membrane protein beta-barrel domain
MQNRIKIAALLLILGLGAATEAAAAGTSPKFWVMPTVGVRSTGTFRIQSPDLPYTTIQLGDGFTYGLSFGYRFSPALALEATWSRQKTGVQGTIPASETTPAVDVPLFDALEDQLQANLLLSPGYKFGSIDPYFLLGLGVTSLNPQTDVQSVTHFSWSAGFGVQAQFGRLLGLRAQGKFTPTYVNTTDVIWEGGMQVLGVRNQMTQWEFQAGLVFHF